MQSHSIARLRRLLTGILAALTLVVIGLLAWEIPRGIHLETNLQALFPQDKDNKMVEKINDQLYKEFGNKILIAVQAADAKEVQQAADLLAQAIAKNPSLKQESINESSEQLSQQQALLQQYRYQLLTPKQRTQLQHNHGDELLSQAQAALFGFNPGGAALSPISDPLNLNAAYLQQLQPAINGELVNDRLLISDDKGQLVLFALNLNGEAFNLDLQEQIHGWLQDTKAQLKNNPATANSDILVSGAVFHAAQASIKAQQEMSIIGAGDVIGSVLLFLLTFFRIKPLLLSITSILFGFAVALAFNQLWFGSIHLMTLVFGTSLIGVAIDYSVHYLCKHQALFNPQDGKESAKKIIHKLLPALTMGLLASIVGYACLLQPTLPGLKQIASFSITGLCGSWLFVVVTYPWFVKEPLPQAYFVIDKLAALVWRFWASISANAWRALLGAFAILIVIGLYKFQFSSDIRTLYKPSAELMYSEQRLQQVLQGVSPNQYFLVRATTPEQLLQAEEKLRKQLEPLVARGALKAYVATSSLVPSQAQQLLNYQLQNSDIYSPRGLAEKFMQSAGFDEQAVAQSRAEFSSAANQELLVEDWLKVARADQRLLWLGQIDQHYVSVIGLRGVTDLAALEQLDDKNSIIWVNRVASISSLLKHLTLSATYMLVLAYAVILVFLWFAYRRINALLLISVPVLTTLVTLSLLSIAGVPITIFHIFGCYLVMGLGMDYAIFSYTEGSKDPISQRSIWLSAVTGGLSFGLLTLSSTPMVFAFGITVLLGCFFNLFFAPLVGNLNKRSEKAEQASPMLDEVNA